MKSRLLHVVGVVGREAGQATADMWQTRPPVNGESGSSVQWISCILLKAVVLQSDRRAVDLLHLAEVKPKVTEVGRPVLHSWAWTQGQMEYTSFTPYRRGVLKAQLVSVGVQSPWRQIDLELE